MEGAGDQMIRAWEALTLPPGDSVIGTPVQHRLLDIEEVEGAGDQMIRAWEGLALPPGDSGLGTPVQHRLQDGLIGPKGLYCSLLHQIVVW